MTKEVIRDLKPYYERAHRLRMEEIRIPARLFDRFHRQLVENIRYVEGTPKRSWCAIYKDIYVRRGLRVRREERP